MPSSPHKAPASVCDSVDRPRPFLEHLNELRTCVIRCAVAWAACALAMVPLCPWIVRWLQAPLEAAGQDPAALVRVFEIDAGMTFIIQVMLWGGTVLSLPLLLFFIARFVFPGLRPVERRWVGGVLGVGGLFLLLGVAVGYRYVLPVAFEVLVDVIQWLGLGMGPLRLNAYTKIVLQTVLAFGLAFELPLTLVILGWMGVLPSRLLRDKRRHAIVAIFFIAMLLTPPDAVSMLAMALPMCLIYEFCILLVRLRELGRLGRPRAAARG